MERTSWVFSRSWSFIWNNVPMSLTNCVVTVELMLSWLSLWEPTGHREATALYIRQESTLKHHNCIVKVRNNDYKMACSTSLCSSQTPVHHCTCHSHTANTSARWLSPTPMKRQQKWLQDPQYPPTLFFPDVPWFSIGRRVFVLPLSLFILAPFTNREIAPTESRPVQHRRVI